MKLYLIGMPGSGKTTIGKKLAAKLNLNFVDLDHEIEDHEGKSIAEIFSTKGEAYFRTLESKLLNNWATSDKSFVMGTGGGAPCFHNGIDIINESGTSIFLEVPIEQLIKRVEKKSDRPLLQAEDTEALTERLQTILANREQIYQRANHTVQNATVDLILAKLNLQ